MSKNEVITKKKEKKYTMGDVIFTSIFTIAFIIQIILMLLFFNEMDLIILYYTGWVIWVFSIYFGLISFRVFKKKGGVEKGKNYVHTTILVDTGPYGLVRHPQYLGGILFSISITLWTQILLSFILTIVIIVLTYHWTYSEEKNLIKKFGDQYQKYQKRVSRLNPIVGIINYYKRKKE